VPIIYFFYPETSNISLEEIDKLFIKPGEGDDESMESGEAHGNVEEAKGADTEHLEKV
jgi:hypothetical protein